MDDERAEEIMERSDRLYQEAQREKREEELEKDA